MPHIISKLQKSRISGILPPSLKEEHEEVKFVLPGSPLPSDESLETELLPPPPSPTMGMRKLSFQIVDDKEEINRDTESSGNDGSFNDEKNSWSFDNSAQLMNQTHDVKAATITKDNPSTTGGENIKSNIQSSTCER